MGMKLPVFLMILMLNGSTLIAGGSIQGVTSQLRFPRIQPRSDGLLSLFGIKHNLAVDNDKRLTASASGSDSVVKPPKVVHVAHHGGADLGLGIYESQYWSGYQYGNYGGVPYSTYFPTRTRPPHDSRHKIYHSRSQYKYAPGKFLWA